MEIHQVLGLSLFVKPIDILGDYHRPVLLGQGRLLLVNDIRLGRRKVQVVLTKLVKPGRVTGKVTVTQVILSIAILSVQAISRTKIGNS